LIPGSWSRHAGAGTFSCRPAAQARGRGTQVWKVDFERRHYALLGLMCIYGIELLPDNIAECRANLLEILAEYLNLHQSD